MSDSRYWLLHASAWSAAVWNYQPVIPGPYECVGVALAALFLLRAVVAHIEKEGT